MVSAPSTRKKRREAEKLARREQRRAELNGRMAPITKFAIAAGLLFTVIIGVLGVRAWLADPLARGREALAAGNYRTARVDLMTAADAAPRDASIRLSLARAYNALGRGREAERNLIRAGELGASPASLRTELAIAQLAQGRAADAIATIGQGSIPASDAARALRTVAQAQYQTGNVRAAADGLAAAIARDGDDAENWIALARFRLAEQDVLGADQAADEARRRAPQSAAALAIKAEVVRNRGGPVAAIPWYEQATEADADNVPVMAEYAATLGEAGQYRAMLVPLRRSLALEPGNGRALLLAATVAARGGEHALARTLLMRMSNVDGDRPAALLLRAAVEMALGTPSTSARFANALVQQQPDNRQARRLLAMALLAQDNARGAITVIDPITTSPDADSWSLLLLSRSFSAIDWQIDAAQPLDRASRLTVGDTRPLAGEARAGDPLDPAVAIPAIRAQLRSGNAAAALILAERLADANPGVPQARLLVGDAALAGGNPAMAAVHFRRAAELRYDQQTMLRLVHALQRSGDGAAASEALDQYAMRWPQDSVAMRLMAARAAEASDWGAAATALAAAIDRVGPGDALLHAQMARAQLELGEAEAARDHAVRAYRLLPGNAAISGLYGIALHRTGGNAVDARDLLVKAVQLAPDDRLLQNWLAEQSGR
ncbi:MAG: tetratricopeptide repeat protein [Sphingopyxis sp.]|nr:tetratricopeptide repeat protein [Sphingopyxis sp.]